MIMSVENTIVKKEQKRPQGIKDCKYLNVKMGGSLSLEEIFAPGNGSNWKKGRKAVQNVISASVFPTMISPISIIPTNTQEVSEMA